jgi:spore germination cell wall hydrolase CwlJ-like protein
MRRKIAEVLLACAIIAVHDFPQPPNDPVPVKKEIVQEQKLASDKRTIYAPEPSAKTPLPAVKKPEAAKAPQAAQTKKANAAKPPQAVRAKTAPPAAKQPQKVQKIQTKSRVTVASVEADDVELLARMIEAEAGGEPMQGKIAVGAVILNRVNNPRFPKTVKDVIFQKGQFGPAARLSRIKASTASYEAAKRALNGEDPTNGALFFNNRPPQTEKTVLTIGNHHFY